MKLCHFEAGLDRPLFLIAGPCVVESRQLQMDTAGELKTLCVELGIPFIFKSSYDKANRSSGKSFRGPGMREGLEILADVRKTIGVPILTDVHTEQDVAAVGAREGKRGWHGGGVSVRRVPGRGATVGAAGIAPMSARRSRVAAAYPSPSPCIRHVIARYPGGNAAAPQRSRP